MSEEYKKWKDSVDVEKYLEEAIQDEMLLTVDLYKGYTTPSQWKKAVTAQMWNIAHLYEGWSD